MPLITIRVSHLQLQADSALLQDSLVKLLYVEYRFLDYPLEELETPFSLPKKGPPDKIEFNFEKGISPLLIIMSQTFHAIIYSIIINHILS